MYKLPVDPPVGPSYPPDWLSSYDDVVDPQWSQLRCQPDHCYKKLDNAKSAAGSTSLDAAMSKWFAKVDVDLISILGSELPTASRGKPSGPSVSTW